MDGGSAVLNLISLKDKNEFLASLGLIEVGAPAVWSKHNCFGRNVWLRKDEKEMPSKETDVQWLYEGTFGEDPFQRLTLKPKCFIHAIIMKTYRLKAVLNITACERAFGMHHSPREGSIKSGSTQKCNTAELFRVLFQSSGPRERWAGGTSWRKTRSKTHPSLIFKKPEMAQSAREEPGGNA